VDDNEDNKRDRERVEILGDLRGEVMVFWPPAQPGGTAL
jgi:hypothetical protein